MTTDHFLLSSWGLKIANLANSTTATDPDLLEALSANKVSTWFYLGVLLSLVAQFALFVGGVHQMVDLLLLLTHYQLLHFHHTLRLQVWVEVLPIRIQVTRNKRTRYKTSHINPSSTYHKCTHNMHEFFFTFRQKKTE